MENHLFIVILRYLVPIETILHYREAHREFLECQYEKGLFLISGPQVPRFGGIILARSHSREELLHILHQDPFYERQCAEYQVYEFSPTKYSDPFKEFLENTPLKKQE